MTTLRSRIVSIITGSPLTKGQDKATLYGAAPLQGPRIIGSDGDWVIVKFDMGNHVEIEYMTPEEAKAAGAK